MFRNRLLGGVSHFALFAPDGPAGGGQPQPDERPVDQVTVDQTGTVEQQPDDGFTAEERAQFDEMARGPVDAPEGEAAEKPAPVEGQKTEEQTETAAEGDDDDGADEETVGREGEQPEAKKSRRVNRRTYERDIAARDARIKELESTVTTNQEMQARLDERLKIINEALTPKQREQQEQDQEDDPEPDAEADIFEHNRWLKRRLDRTEAQIKQLGGSVQQRAAEQELDSWYANDSRRFIQQQPDFMDAYNFMLASRVRELGFQRFRKDFTKVQPTPQEGEAIRRALEAEERQLVRIAAEGGGSAAELIYGMALARNYTPKQAEAAAEAATGDKGNGAAKAALPAKTGNGKSDVMEEIKRVKAGVEASTSLSQAGGAPPMALDMKKLADMSQEEFNALADQLSDQDWARVAGGR